MKILAMIVAGLAPFSCLGSLLDPSFDAGPIAPTFVPALVAQADGKIVICGDFRTNSYWLHRILRLNPNGSWDPTFDPDQRLHARPNQMAIQPDGKILLAGVFTNLAGLVRNRMARLETDGTVDASFEPPARYRIGETNAELSVAGAVELLSDGKLLVAGVFVSGVPCVLRLHPDGTQDLTFVPYTPPNLLRGITAVQNDKILVSFGYANPLSLVLLNSDGTVNSTNFAPSLPVSADTLMQPDGKILVDFSQWCNDYGPTPLRRILPTGVEDPDWNPPSFEPATFTHMECWRVTLGKLLVQPDGKIVVAGTLAKVNGEARGPVFRLRPNGTLDSSFDTSDLRALHFGDAYFFEFTSGALLPDGRVIVGGGFTLFDGIHTRSNLIRLLPFDPAKEIILRNPRWTEGRAAFEIESPNRRPYQVEASIDLEHWSVTQSYPAPQILETFTGAATNSENRLFYRLQTSLQ